MSKFDVGAFFVSVAWRRQKVAGGCPCKDACILLGQFWVLPLKISFGRRMEADLAPRNGFSLTKLPFCVRELTFSATKLSDSVRDKEQSVSPAFNLEPDATLKAAKHKVKLTTHLVKVTTQRVSVTTHDDSVTKHCYFATTHCYFATTHKSFVTTHCCNVTPHKVKPTPQSDNVTKQSWLAAFNGLKLSCFP